MAENFKRPVFCSVFDLANEHIMKDHGLLSWGMMEYHGYDSVLATFDNGEYPNMKYIPGVRMEFIPRITGDFAHDSVSWLKKNAKKIDVMHVYHMNRIALSKVLTYKFFNPRGKVYLKMDGCPMPHHKKAWMHPTSYALTKLCKCISTELEGNSKRLSRAWGRKIIWVPNPANPKELQDCRLFSERSDVIITVGRLGTKQKATEILLEAFVKLPRKFQAGN